MMQKQLGCLFGNLIAQCPEENKIHAIVVQTRFNEKGFAEEVNKTLADAVGENEAVLLTFPHLSLPVA